VIAAKNKYDAGRKIGQTIERTMTKTTAFSQCSWDVMPFNVKLRLSFYTDLRW
jgi:hypothetical protein